MNETALRLSRRQLMKGAGALGLTVIAQACGATQTPSSAPAAASETPPTGAPTGTFSAIQASTLVSLDSTIENGMLVFNPATRIFDTLLVSRWEGGDVKIRPRLATDWSNPDDRSIRLKLREGVKFHSGETLTADDVVYTWKRVIDPKTKSLHAAYVQAIGDVRALDANTVQFDLKRPDATLLGRMTRIPIIPRKMYEGQPLERVSDNPVGTGPWRFKEWTKGQRVVMEANMEYWGGPPRTKTIIWRSIPEATTRVTELLTGNADLVDQVPPSLAGNIKSEASTNLEQVRGMSNIFLKINCLKKPWDDVRVRRALNHAVDVKLITETLLGGFAVPTPGGVMGPGVWGHPANVDKGYEYNPAKAKQLLAEAGVAPGTKLTLVEAQGTNTGDDDTIVAVSRMFAEVGFDTQVKQMDFAVVLGEWNRKYNPAMDVMLWSNPNATGDADYNYSRNWLSPQKGGGGVYWSSSEMDDLIIKGTSTLDETERLKIYQKIGQTIFDQATNVFLYDLKDTYGVAKRVRGLELRPDQYLDVYPVWVRS